MTTQLKDSQTFRVFFSSPFKGMEEEREELTRKYFPEIQHRCAEMGLQFVAVDMRWGISMESAQQAQTINICFREIDRSDMFVNFFGQRYGWQGDALVQENINVVLGKYPWLEAFRDRSITELEVRHGFLNNPGDVPAIICFRDKKYDDVMREMVKDKAANYTSESEDSATKLESLRKKVVELQSEALAVHEDYPNPHEGARLIYEAIIQYLNENILKQSGELSRREKDLAPHRAFAASRTSFYVRNQDHYNILNNALMSMSSEKGEEDQDCPHIVVTGAAGCGKSSLLCDWLHSQVSQLPQVIAIPYYIGCAPGTRDPEGLLDFVYGELEHYLGDADKAKDSTENPTNSNNSHNGAGSSDQIHNSAGRDNSGAQIDSKLIDQNANSISVNETVGTESKSTDTDQTTSDSTGAAGSSVSVPQPDKTVSSDSNSKLAQKGTDGTGKVPDKDDNDTSTSKENNSDESKTDMKKSAADKAANDDDGKEKAKAKGDSRPKGRELQHQVVSKLEKLVGKGHTVLLVFDALNRLVPANKTSKTLYWLPKKLCHGVMCVVSTEETDEASLSILQKERGFRVLRLGRLEESTQSEICVLTLKHSGKELSPSQLDRVVKAKQTENPLFLKIVLAELSIFGYFRKLDEKIDSLIHLGSVKELLHNCLGRLEADYNDVTYEINLVAEIMKSLYVSHRGLAESEICNIFKIPSNVWSPLYFAMEYFIVSHMGNLGFAFAEIREAVKERYFPDAAAESRARKRLISYFDGIRKQLQPWAKSKRLLEKPLEHAVVELVWLQQREDDREAVANTLTDLAVFRIMNDEHDLELLELWQWTGLKWSEVCSRLLRALDIAIADCYLAHDEGRLDEESNPGVMMRVAVSHMRAFFDLANCTYGSEKVLEREIRILENAEGKMKEQLRKELLRDAYYYLACTYATQDRYQESKNLHQTNMAEIQRSLEEKEDEEARKQIAYTHNGLGILCMHAGEYEKSIEHLTQSTEFHHKNKDRKNEAAGYTNMALVYMYQQDFQKALEYNNKALEAYEEGLFGQQTMDVGNVYTNMGLVHRRMKNLNKAEEAYLKSLEIKANAVGWDHLVIATAFMNLGTLEMHRRNYAKAEQWTRKAIGVYQANELAVTKKEYRRCRENLFANILKQEKYEEVLPLYLEIFDTLHQNGWLEECLAGMHRKMVEYMLNNKPQLLDKAEEITLALIDSPKAHPQNYGQLLAIDQERRPDGQELLERPYKYTLDACMDKFPTHAMYDTIVELKMEMFLLPKEDRGGVRVLLQHVTTHCTDGNFESIISKVTAVAKEQSKERFWFQCLKDFMEELPADKKVFQLFVRLCVLLDCVPEALPFLDAFLDHFRDGEGKLQADQIRPPRTRLDVAKVLSTQGSADLARELLLLVTAKSLNAKEKEEAKAMLDILPEPEEYNVNTQVTSAA